MQWLTCTKPGQMHAEGLTHCTAHGTISIHVKYTQIETHMDANTYMGSAFTST